MALHCLGKRRVKRAVGQGRGPLGLASKEGFDGGAVGPRVWKTDHQPVELFHRAVGSDFIIHDRKQSDRPGRVCICMSYMLC